MSDSERNDITDKVSETATPDSQKPLLDKAKEGTSSTYSSVASAQQPGDTKSTTQKLSDEASSATGSAKETGKSVLQQAAGALDSAQKAVADLANKISGDQK